MIEGEPGIGKTTIWREAITRAVEQGQLVLSSRASQAEARLSFTGLGDLLAPIDATAFADLPPPQRRGLEVALLRVDAAGIPPDPRAIATGFVTLVSGLASRSPVVLALDDYQWLDRPTARVLEFALRRLEGSPVAVLATVRTGVMDRSAGLSGGVRPDRLQHVRLGPLSMAALYEILKEELGSTLTRPLLGSIERASRGNPFYALELARAHATDTSRAAGEQQRVPGDARDLLAKRLRRLPQATRDELLKMSAVARPTVGLVDIQELQPAVDAGVVSIGEDGHVEFSHPLFARAVYGGVSADRRRRLHRELAELLTNPEERARHLSLASAGPDERLAEILDHAAELAYLRGAREVAAELTELAAERTPVASAASRSERLMRAARHHHKAGDSERARTLCAEVVGASGPTPLRAKALHLLAEVNGLEKPTTAIPLLEEALRYTGDDREFAAQLETDFGMAALVSVDLVGAEAHLSRAVELAGDAGKAGLLAVAMAMRTMARFLMGRGVEEAMLTRSIDLEDPEREASFQLRPSMIAAHLYEWTGRIAEARVLLVGLRDRIVSRGEEGDLPWVLVHLSATSGLAGDLVQAEGEASDALRVANLTGQEINVAFALLLRGTARAILGDLTGSRSDLVEALAISDRADWWWGQSQSRLGMAVLAITEGNPGEALAILEPVIPIVEALGVYEWPIAWAVPEAIEALVAENQLDRAARLTDALSDWGRRFDRPWASALSGRGRAMVEAAQGHLPLAQAAAEQAVVDHERLPMPFELGRTLLVLGQIQRRRGERLAARETLRQSRAIFESLPAPFWAEKVWAEERRIGTRRAPIELTENERLVAQLAAGGLTNREIAARLFLSRRTVEANLARAYRKLEIHSRAELGATMATRRDSAPS